MSKQISNTTILSITGKPYLIPKRSDDGDVEWINLEQQLPDMEEATPSNLLRMIILTLPRTMQAQNDGQFSYQLWQDVLQADGTEYIKLHDKVYSWLHRLLNRQVPLSKEDKDSGITPKTLAIHYFGASDYTIIQQLKDKSDRTLLNPDLLPDN